MSEKRSVTFGYFNWKGDFRKRTVEPVELWFGATEWHQDQQWLLKAVDIDDGNTKDFAVSGIPENDLAQLGRNAISALSELERERDELRARLAEYEQAPTVAVVKGEYGLDLTYRYPFSDKPPPVGTELIARQTRKGE